MDSPPRPALQRWLPPVLAALAPFVAFFPALSAGWVNWDDPVNFQSNPHYRGLGPDQLKWMWANFTGHYMPLTWMTLGADYALWGMHAKGYHLTNLVLHAVNSVFCYYFLLVLLRRSRVAEGASEIALGLCALAGALFWTIHPLRVESVAWITERRDLVAGLFTFPCLLAYLRAVPAGGGKADGRWLAASVVLFALSLLGKAIGMTLPLALLVLDAVPLGRLQRGADGRVPWLPVVAEKIPFFAVMIAGVAMTALGQAAAGAVHGSGSHGLANFVVQPGWRLTFYLGKILVPLGLSPLYPFHQLADQWAPKLLLAGAAALGLTILAWRFRKTAPGLLAAWLAFVLLLGPVLGPIQAGPHFAADRYTYLAALPFSILAAAGLLAWVRRGGTRPATAVAALSLAVLAALSIDQTRIWDNSIDLWTKAIAVDPSSNIPFTNRGSAYGARRRFAEALADFDAAIALTPTASKPHTNRAHALGELGRRKEALAEAELALKLDPNEPRAWLVRGGLLLDSGRPQEAVRDYTKALELDETAIDAWVGRARARGALGDFPGVIRDTSLALVLHPFQAEARLNRALARGETGDLAGAAEDYGVAIDADPSVPEAWAGRGMVRGLQNRWPEAAADLQRALDVAPSDWPHRADATRRLQDARAKSGR